MPRPSWQRLPAAQRERILDAAIEEFGQHGYASGNLAVIAHAAGLEDGWLLRYFDDRTDFMTYVAQAVINRITESMVADIATVLPETDFVELAVRIVEVWMEYLATHPLERGATAAALMELDPQVRRAIRGPAHDIYVEGVRPLIQMAVAARALRPDTDVDAVLALFWLVIAYLGVAPYEPGVDMGMPMHATPGRTRARNARRLVETLLYGVVPRPE